MIINHLFQCNIQKPDRAFNTLCEPALAFLSTLTSLLHPQGSHDPLLPFIPSSLPGPLLLFLFSSSLKYRLKPYRGRSFLCDSDLIVLCSRTSLHFVSQQSPQTGVIEYPRVREYILFSPFTTEAPLRRSFPWSFLYHCVLGDQTAVRDWHIPENQKNMWNKWI